MTRNELYNNIDACGNLDYTSMIYLLNATDFVRQSDRFLLLNRVSQGGQLSHEDWKMFIRRVTFAQGGSVTKDQVMSL